MKVERHFVAEPPAVRDARKFTEDALSGLPESKVADVVLMVSELATNSVNHAESDFTLALDWDLSNVRIEVTDHGGALPRKSRPKGDEPHGRGLQIVDSLSDAWGVDALPDGGKTIWSVVPMGARTDAAASAQAPAFDELVPRWLFAIKANDARLAVGTLTPILVAVVLASFSHPDHLRLGPILTLVLIGVAATTGWRSTAIAAMGMALNYWWFGVPPVRSFALHKGDDAISVVGFALTVGVIAALTWRVERTVEEVRELDHERRDRSKVEADLRHRAERTASQAEAVLSLGNVLAGSRSPEEVADAVLSQLDQPVPPTTGSIALVRHNRLQVLASHGSTPEFITALERVDLSRSPWLGEVLHGTPAFVEDRDEFAEQFPNAAVLRMYPSGSWLVLPFRSEKSIGLLSLHFAERQPLKDYRLYFSLVGELLGSTLERAQSEENLRLQNRELESSLAERDRIARTLSTSLLPPTLPRLNGFNAVGWLRPASTDQVAGDFYDVFAAGDGGWVAVLGDVCGKGAEAAAVTSLTRYAARAAALDDPDPANVARVANGALSQDQSELFCTMAVVRYEQESECLEITLAGHPKVRHIRGGQVQRVGTYAAAIGLAEEPPVVDSVRMQPGDMVVLFSDGLIERDPLFRETEFDMFLAHASRGGAAGLSEKIHELLDELRPIHPDDVALLVLERTV